MSEGHAGLHEPADALRPQTVEMHRAVVSLIEELEAIDWYAQRVDASSDAELRRVLEHNRDEEKEHACMTLEWIRRRDPRFDALLRRILFSEGPIAEEPSERSDAPYSTPRGNGSADSGLGIGGLREEGRR